MDKVEIIEKRVEGNNIIFTAYYYPDEKDANTKIKFEQRQASDFLMTTDGQKDTMAKLLDSGRNRWNVNQIATDKSGAYDLPTTFDPTDTIKTPVETTPTPEQIFQEAVQKLEQSKRYMDLGLISKEQYDVELAKVKALMPK
ncbi:MAG: hypothetical protein WC319_04720 [Candidatus Paceibacterota bacterium]|jgi:hypothetical protein